MLPSGQISHWILSVSCIGQIFSKILVKEFFSTSFNSSIPCYSTFARLDKEKFVIIIVWRRNGKFAEEKMKNKKIVNNLAETKKIDYWINNDEISCFIKLILNVKPITPSKCESNVLTISRMQHARTKHQYNIHFSWRSFNFSFRSPSDWHYNTLSIHNTEYKYQRKVKLRKKGKHGLQVTSVEH